MNPVGAESEGAAEFPPHPPSAAPERKIEASPAALLVKAKPHRKILFSLREEKIRRAQNEKSKEYFSVGYASGASGGGLASLIPFKESSSKVYNYSTNTELKGFSETELWAALCAAHLLASSKPLSSILVSLLYQARTYFQNK